MAKVYIGYARVSTEDQNEARQIESFRTFREPVSKIFIDKCSGKNMERPQLKAMLEYVREGIEIAKAQGKYKGRKPLPVDEDLFRREIARWRNGEQTAKETMLHLQMKPNRFYRKVKALGL